jgi:Cdc6-like AAA superfamily ATPase
LLYADDLRLKFETFWPGVELAKSEPPASAKQLCESSSIEASLKWFTDSSEYKSWKAGTLTKLWLHGRHGDGKTVIMSYVARSLSQYNTHSDEHYLVSIFCSCHDSVEGLVASIALQLLQNKGLDKASLLQLPISKFRQGGGRVYSSRLLLEVLIMLISASRPKISLLLDGIDKLDVHVRSTFLEKFYNVVVEVRDLNIRVLMSSETNANIRNALTDYSPIDREKLRSGE